MRRNMDENKNAFEVIYYRCPNCGYELYGNGGKLGSGMRFTKNCPLCEAKLSLSAGYCLGVHRSKDVFESNSWKQGSFGETYLFPSCSIWDADTHFEYLKQQRRETEEKQCAEMVASFIEAKKAELPIHKNSFAKETISGETQKLQEYILNVVNVEKNIYSISQRLTGLYRERNDLKQTIYQYRLSNSQEIKDAQEYYQKLASGFDSYHGRLKDHGLPPLEFPPKPQKPAEPVMEEAGFFNRKAVQAKNAERKAEYDAACQKYKAELNTYEKKIEELKKQRKAQEDLLNKRATQNLDAAQAAISQARKNIKFEIEDVEILPLSEKTAKVLIDDEISDAEELLTKLVECRANLYGYDIIFGKYHNLIAASTFYEYLATGRCTGLTGADGAYNLFEAECKANQIIGQLSQVIVSLEQIKESQYTIYTELQKVNSNLDRLNNTMSAALKSLRQIENNTQHLERIADNSDIIAHNSEVIAHNTAVTAYYSKVNAELTNALGYMVAFK